MCLVRLQSTQHFGDRRIAWIERDPKEVFKRFLPRIGRFCGADCKAVGTCWHISDKRDAQETGFVCDGKIGLSTQMLVDFDEIDASAPQYINGMPAFLR